VEPQTNKYLNHDHGFVVFDRVYEGSTYTVESDLNVHATKKFIPVELHVLEHLYRHLKDNWP
jgi:hypothetical protein